MTVNSKLIRVRRLVGTFWLPKSWFVNELTSNQRDTPQAELSGRRWRIELPRRWPPSAAQTVRAGFPHTAFTKTQASENWQARTLAITYTRLHVRTTRMPSHPRPKCVAQHLEPGYWERNFSCSASMACLPTSGGLPGMKVTASSAQRFISFFGSCVSVASMSPLCAFSMAARSALCIYLC